MYEKLMNSLKDHIGEPRWYNETRPIIVFNWLKLENQESAIDWLGEYGFFLKGTDDDSRLQAIVDKGEGAWITDTFIPLACVGEHYGQSEDEFPFVEQVDELWFAHMDIENKSITIYTWDTDAPEHKFFDSISAFDLPGFLSDEDPWK